MSIAEFVTLLNAVSAAVVAVTAACIAVAVALARIHRADQRLGIEIDAATLKQLHADNVRCQAEQAVLRERLADLEQRAQRHEPGPRALCY